MHRLSPPIRHVDKAPSSRRRRPRYSFAQDHDLRPFIVATVQTKPCHPARHSFSSAHATVRRFVFLSDRSRVKPVEHCARCDVVCAVEKAHTRTSYAVIDQITLHHGKNGTLGTITWVAMTPETGAYDNYSLLVAIPICTGSPLPPRAIENGYVVNWEPPTV